MGNYLLNNGLDRNIEKSEDEKIVEEFYENVWPEFVRWWCAEETLGLHYAFYEDGIRTFKEAILNMNDFVGRLLGLEEKELGDILDAGCGVGGTSIYLANKYPNSTITGITITPEQVELAKKFAQERNVNNVKFMLSSYANIELPDNYFDGVFALESACYAKNISDFIDEMYRLLKSKGRLVVIDGFRKDDIPLNPVMQKIYEGVCKDRGYAHPPSLNTYTSHLKEKGFTGIIIRDISKNVSRSQLRSFLIGIPFFLSTSFKRLKFGKYKLTEDFVDYSFGTSVPAAIVGLSGVVGYYAITAIKK